MSHLKAALRAAGLPADPRADRHYRCFWTVRPHHLAPQRKRFTDGQVREIRRRANRGESKIAIARLYGVAPWTIYRLTNGHTYKHVTEQAA